MVCAAPPVAANSISVGVAESDAVLSVSGLQAAASSITGASQRYFFILIRVLR